jgi:hypothetical protein
MLAHAKLTRAIVRLLSHPCPTVYQSQLGNWRKLREIDYSFFEFNLSPDATHIIQDKVIRTRLTYGSQNERMQSER